MLKTIKKIIMSASLFGVLALPLALPAVASAQTQIEGGLCAGANLNVKDTTCDSSTDTEAQDKVNSFITTIINIFSVVVGVVAVIMIIIGGFKYITSGGDSGNVSGAKNTILFAVVGLIIVALAQFLVRFVLTKVTSSGA
jgi:hypothetical protein